jgi:hypothetical protein
VPASTDYWINDSSGDPLLVITGEVDATLSKAMPRLLQEVREAVGERRVTIVFDRGGWSPKLFAAMIKDGFDVLTYRKAAAVASTSGGSSAISPSSTSAWRTIFCRISPCVLSRAGCACGKSRACATTAIRRRDIEVAYRMFERWRQENFFKYMREEFLDALVDYPIEPEGPTRTIPNPKRRALDKEIRAARADLARLERELGAPAANNAGQRRPTRRGFKIAHSRLGRQLRKARARMRRLFDQLRNVPKRVEVRELNKRAVVKLAIERKHLTDIIKIIAYQAGSDLLATAASLRACRSRGANPVA